MGLFQDRYVPAREDRISACMAFGGTACGLGRSDFACLKNQNRSFSQAGLCQALPTLGMLLTLPDTAVVVHGSIGCASSGFGSNINIRLRHLQRGYANARDSVWVSTNLTESDVIHGGEQKLEQTILETIDRFHPQTVVVLQTCAPSIIGDDLLTIVDKVRQQVDIPILAAVCEGFKTKIWATGYDVAFHAIAHGIIENDKEGRPQRIKNSDNKRRPLINLINLASIGQPDEEEITRLLNAIGIDVNIGPNFATRESIRNMIQADLTVSICPTHDEYFTDYLYEEFDIPFILKDMPIGLENTKNWLLDIAGRFGLEAKAIEIIDGETRKVLTAVEKYKPLLQGKRVFLSAGEFRALVTGSLFQELGMEVVGIRSYHHDQFGRDLYGKLVETQNNKDFIVDIANFQPFELSNLLERVKPDLFVGHIFDNVWAARLGYPIVTAFRIFDHYVGYRGFYEVAKKTARVLSNPNFNRNLAQKVKNPYKSAWFEEEPFKYIQTTEAVNQQ